VRWRPWFGGIYQRRCGAIHGQCDKKVAADKYMITTIKLLLMGSMAIAMLSGCMSQGPTVGFVSGTPQPDDNHLTYMLLPFQDIQAADAQKIYPHAPEILSLAVESALVARGKHVVRGQADIEISGAVTAYYMGTFGGHYSTVGLDLKAVDKRSGLVVWSASNIHVARWYYNTDPALLAYTAADEMMEKVFPGKKAIGGKAFSTNERASHR
jgi:hypothetical protein